MEQRSPPTLTALVAIALAALGTIVPGRGEAQSAPPVAAQNAGENGVALHRSERSVVLTLTYTSDANADISGGERRGTAYLQRIGVIADADLAQAIGWRGASAHLSVHSIVGTGLSASRVGNLLTVSGIEAAPALRLFNLWVEQRVGTTASLRVGQFSAGQEFAISPTATLFVNSTFGWPGSFAVDLPGGGPAYPIAVPGARIASSFDGGRTVLRAAVFTGNPPGRDVHGFAGFRFAQPPLAIAEIARTARGDDPAWTVVLGGWASFDRFADVRQPLRMRRGNQAAYVIGDARLWAKGTRSVHGFARFTVSPANRNVVGVYGDAGVTLTGAIATRPLDVLGVAVGVARIASAFPAAGALAGSSASPPPELAIEASYQAHVGKMLSLQPNVQLILNPYDASAPTAQPLRRAIVMGLRTALRF